MEDNKELEGAEGVRIVDMLNEDGVFSKKYRLLRKISEGGYGKVYSGVHVKSSEFVAIKVAFKLGGTSTLLNEARLMIRLQRDMFIPKIRSYGECSKLGINYIVMELLGECINYENVCGEVLDIKDRGILLINIFLQLLSLMECLHGNNFVYRDVKPSNFLFGLGKNSRRVYMIDFGFVKCFRSVSGVGSGLHVPFRGGLKPLGTVMYMSVNAHRGYEQSRRDDLESLGYLFYYLCVGSLPWDDYRGDMACVDHLDIADRKDEFKQRLKGDNFGCVGLENIREYFRCVSLLGYMDVPNYEMIKYNISCVDIF